MKKYHKDYEKDGRGIRYMGDIYKFPLENGEKKKILLNNIIYQILYILFIILAGLVNNGGNRSLFIVVPYVCLFLPCAYLGMGILSVPGLSERMEKVAWDKAIGRMFRSCVGIFVLSLYLLVADSIYLLRQARWQEWNALHETVFLCTCIAVISTALAQMTHLQNIRKKVMIIRHNEEVPIGK